MDKFVIDGQKKLHGNVKVSGSKNAALPIIAATTLCDSKCVITNVPDLADITTMLKLLENMGCVCSFENNKLEIDCIKLKSTKAEYDLVRKMRASILVLGPILTKYSHVDVSLPGGCAIGVRPVNLHIDALRAMGAKIDISQGYIHASAHRLKGAEIYFDMPTVTGTENVLMAASLADGKTTIYNAAKEPEVVDLANFLNMCGAKISGAGSSTIEVIGVTTLKGATYEVMSDRIEAGTFMCIASATLSNLTIKNAPVYCMHAIVDKLKESGAHIIVDENTINISQDEILPVNIKTFAYPGFPTDMQAQLTSLLAMAKGTSVIEETIFENRFQHVAELNRMGADITISGNKAIVKGVKKLLGAPVMATDLRASASLVIAGLAAQNTTEVLRIYHLDRGYENLDKKLQDLGARIKRVPQ